MTRFGIVGGAYRAQGFLRIVRELAEAGVPGLEVSGVVVRDAAKGSAVERRWGVPTVRDIPALLAGERPDFVLVAVNRPASEAVLTELAAADVPVLAETPPAPDVAGLERLHALARGGARIQVAEQYHLEPLLSSQIAVARSGLLGTVREAFVSRGHDYHGVSVLRRMLGVGLEDAAISANETVATVVAGPTREGDPTEERLIEERHVTARLEFTTPDGPRVATYDFSSDQYRSWIRSGSVLARGDRGELRDETVRYLADFRTPILDRIERRAAGGATNLEGMFLRGLTLGERWLYRNPFMPARLTDEELGMAAALARMADYVAGGPELYPLAEAAQDHYLQLLVREALRTGSVVRSEPQAWAR